MLAREKSASERPGPPGAEKALPIAEHLHFLELLIVVLPSRDILCCIKQR
jgi:hypothetical protein